MGSPLIAGTAPGSRVQPAIASASHAGGWSGDTRDAQLAANPHLVVALRVQPGHGHPPGLSLGRGGQARPAVHAGRAVPGHHAVQDGRVAGQVRAHHPAAVQQRPQLPVHRRPGGQRLQFRGGAGGSGPARCLRARTARWPGGRTGWRARHDHRDRGRTRPGDRQVQPARAPGRPAHRTGPDRRRGPTEVAAPLHPARAADQHRFHREQSQDDRGSGQCERFALHVVVVDPGQVTDERQRLRVRLVQRGPTRVEQRAVRP